MATWRLAEPTLRPANRLLQIVNLYEATPVVLFSPRNTAV